MKISSMIKTLVLAVMIIAGCQPNKNKDSSEVAKEQNDAVIDDNKEEKDADFVVNAVAASIAEINLAQLALSKSTDSNLKQMATTLAADHTNVLRSLQGYAATKGISVPTSETEEAMEDRNDLTEKAGKDFDKEWCEHLQSDHKKTIDKFESRMNKTEDVALKDLISNTLPVLNSHLDMLKSHEEAIKK
jgi:putative membrane protein